MLLPLVGFGAALVLMLTLWRRQLRTQNATSVDVAWSWSLAALAIGYAAFSIGDP